MMGVITEKRGRPRYIAEYPEGPDPARPYYDQFRAVCSTFTYREMLALSRMLGYNLRTIYKWRDQQNFPRDIGVVLITLEWARQGKPITQEKRRRLARINTMW